MITSQSNHEEIKRFFQTHTLAITERLFQQINTKYRRNLVKIKQRGGEFPQIFETYKVGNVTFYGCPFGLQHAAGNCFIFKGVRRFLIMKDIRTQKRIMVVNSSPYPTIYSTHAISRYQERLGLDENLDFVDICKDMLFAGCADIQASMNMGKIYGSDLSTRIVELVCTKGAFLGYYSVKTKVLHAETFLSTNELTEKQQYLDINKNPHLKGWMQLQELFNTGEITIEKYFDLIQERHGHSLFTVENGQMQIMSEEEENKELVRMSSLDPSYWGAQIAFNKQKAINRMNRKGYM